MCTGVKRLYTCGHSSVFLDPMCGQTSCNRNLSLATNMVGFDCWDCSDDDDRRQRYSRNEENIRRIYDTIEGLIPVLPRKVRETVVEDENDLPVTMILKHAELALNTIVTMRKDNHRLRHKVRDLDAESQRVRQDLARIQPLLARTASALKKMTESTAGQDVLKVGLRVLGLSAPAETSSHAAETLELIQRLQSFQLNLKEDGRTASPGHLAGVMFEKGGEVIQKPLPLAQEVHEASSRERSGPQSSPKSQAEASDNIAAGPANVNEQGPYTNVDGWDVITNQPEAIEVRVHMPSAKRIQFLEALKFDMSEKLREIENGVSNLVARDLCISLLSCDLSEPGPIIVEQCQSASLEIAYLVRDAAFDMQRSAETIITDFNDPSTHQASSIVERGFEPRREDRAVDTFTAPAQQFTSAPSGTGAVANSRPYESSYFTKDMYSSQNDEARSVERTVGDSSRPPAQGRMTYSLSAMPPMQTDSPRGFYGSFGNSDTPPLQESSYTMHPGPADSQYKEGNVNNLDRASPTGSADFENERFQLIMKI